MNYTLINSSKQRMPRKFMEAWLNAISVSLKKRGVALHVRAELTVVFMDPIPAQNLNFQFRQKNYPTDVLSFDGHSDEELGELVLCPVVIERQAKEHQLNFRQELGYMLLHGVLHLLGYDHETSPKDAKKMFALQDEIFDQLCRKFWN